MNDSILVKLSYNGYKIHFSSPSAGYRIIDWQDRVIREVFEPYNRQNVPSVDVVAELFRKAALGFTLREIRDDADVVLWRAEP